MALLLMDDGDGKRRRPADAERAGRGPNPPPPSGGEPPCDPEERSADGGAPERVPFRKRLSYKQARNTVLMTFLLGLVLTGGQIFVDLLQLQKRTDSLVGQVLRTLQEPAAEAAYAFDKALAARVLNGVFEYKPVYQAELRDDFGSVLASRLRQPSDGALKWLAEMLLARDRQYAIPLVIARHGQTVGELRVVIDRHDVAVEFFERAGVVLGAGVLWTVGLALILVVMFYLSITKPFLRLSNAVAQVDPAHPGDGLMPIPRQHREDELGILARAINKLLLQLGQLLERHRAAEDRVREREIRLRGIMENVADGIVTVDAARRIDTMNRAALELFGYAPEDVKGIPFDRLIAVEDVSRLLAALTRCAESANDNRDAVRHELTAVRGDGTVVPIAFSVNQMRLDDRVTFICVVQDITERKRAEEALRESEERLKLAVTATRSGIWDADLRSGSSWWSPEFLAMLGYDPGELPPRVGTWEALIHPDDAPWTTALIQRYLRGEVPEYEPVYRVRRKDGTWVWIEAKGRCLRDDNGVAYRFTGAMSDVTERKRFEEQLMYMATHDPLTGLPNRTLLQDRLQHAMGLVRRKGGTLAVLFLDLDRFKLINDSLGHHIGDGLLKAVSTTLAACVRATDTVGRLGGDEFLVIAEDLSSPQDAGRIAKAMLQALARPMAVEGQDQALFVSPSIGIATYTGEPFDTATMLRHADAAMYSAKSSGGNTYRFFIPEMNEEAVARLTLERSLREAIEQEQFQVFYQPKVDVATLRPVGLEALIRWKHPEKGWIPPSTFIPVAEEVGLIGAVGAWVMRTALRQVAAWQARGVEPLPIAVNVSVRQLTGAGAADTIRAILEDIGTDPRWLELEVTESTMMDNLGSIVETLKDLRALGLKIAVDDFGTGYSSLSYLRRLPITALKVDRSFIDEVTSNADDAAIAATIIAMGNRLGLTIVAEGIETEDQLAFLRRHNCDEAQGYHIARPMPIADLERRFLDGRRWLPVVVGSQLPVA